MSHWAERYTGRRYAFVDGEFDCADLARVVMSEQFGRDITLPPGRDYHGKRGSAKVDAMAAQIAAVRQDYAQPTTDPREGDAVLLIARGRPAHIGIYCVINNEPWVLHAASNAKMVVLHRIRELDRQGLQVEGYYRWT